MRPYRPDRVHARGALDPSDALPARVGSRRAETAFRPAGPIRPRTTRNGPSWSSSGSTLRRAIRQGRGRAWYWEVWNEPNILYWRGTPEEYHKLYDYAVDAVKRALAHGPSRWSARRRTTIAGRREIPARASSITACAARTTPRASRARRSTSSPSTPRACPVRRWARPHGHRRAASGHRPGFRDRRQLPGVERQADHHRRVRPGRLRGLPGDDLPAERLPQRDALLQLHGRRRSPASTCWPRSTGSTSRGP